MRANTYFLLGLILIFTSSIFLSNCSTPTPLPPEIPTPPPASIKTSVDSSIIEGARKEGTVSLYFNNAFLDPRFLPRLTKEISDQYGADLNIRITPTQSGPRTASQLIAEKKAGKAPDYDLITTTLTSTLPLLNEGIVTKVDWKSLITKDTNPDATIEYANFGFPVASNTGQGGIMYNPTKVSTDKIPKSMSDLANPIWKGRVGIFNLSGPLARYLLVISKQVGGMDKAFDVLRAIIKNDAFIAETSQLISRYVLGELWICVLQDFAVLQAKEKAVPAEYKLMGPYDITETILVLPLGAPHPNAAKLISIHIASPSGAKLVWETTHEGNYLYSGNAVYDMAQAAKKEGLPIVYSSRDKESLENMISPEYAQLQKDVTLILQGAK